VSGLSLPGLATAAAAGLFTIVEGDVTVIRYAVKFAAAEGLRLQGDDIIHTGEGARLARIEFAEGGALDIGPSTRVLLRPRFVEPHLWRPAQLYVSQGWVKLTTGAGGKLGMSSPSFDVTDLAGIALARIDDKQAFLFVESGSAKLVERVDGQPPRLRPMKEGEAFDRRGADAGAVTSRPAADLVKSIPRAFVDSLPLRAKRFQGVEINPQSPIEISYQEVAGWINAERTLRPAFLERWNAKARDPKFRAGLVADLRSHPEWDRVLFPEKYVVKRKPASTEAAASAPAASSTSEAPAATAPVSTLPTPPPPDPDRDPLRPWERKR
jgi:hypothetical protein